MGYFVHILSWYGGSGGKVCWHDQRATKAVNVMYLCRYYGGKVWASKVNHSIGIL